MRSGAALRQRPALRAPRALEPRWGRRLAVPAALLLVLVGVLWTTGAVRPGASSRAAAVARSVGAHPAAVTLPVGPGGTSSISTRVLTLPVPPLVDVVLVQDETGSFGDAIGELKKLTSTEIVPALDKTGASYRTGVVGFRDYGQSSWGDGGDWVFRELAPLGSSGTGFGAGVPALSAAGGGDTPEGQLEALAYLVDPAHAPIDSYGDGVTRSEDGDTPAGEQPRWRRGAKRIVLLATDADCHTVGDPGWPGDRSITSAASVARVLKAHGITVVGIVPPDADLSCVTDLATATGGTVQRTDATGSDVAHAIVAGLKALPVSVMPHAVCSIGVTTRFKPRRATVHSGSAAKFQETFARASDGPAGPASCTVSYLVNGKVAAHFEQRVTLVPRAHHRAHRSTRPGRDTR